MTIRSVDNGETLETVQLQKPLEACWWSELYLWVVFEGALVRFPYYSTHSNVLGSGGKVFPLTFGWVLGFGEGIFVFKENDNIISIMKICGNMPFIQKIGDGPFSDAVISKDGCAVLLYHEIYVSTCWKYQLWEFTPENRWELHLHGKTGTELGIDWLKWLSLTGTKNYRRSVWVGCDRTGIRSILCFFDFSSKKLSEYSLGFIVVSCVRVVDVAPNCLLITTNNWLRVLNVSDNKIIATLPLCDYDSKNFFDIFYLSSKDLLLVVFANDIKHFKIHNL